MKTHIGERNHTDSF